MHLGCASYIFQTVEEKIKYFINVVIVQHGVMHHLTISLTQEVGWRIQHGSCLLVEDELS